MTDNSGIAFQKTLMSVIDMLQRTLWCLWHMIMIASLNRNKTSSSDINYWREKSLKQQPIMLNPFRGKPTLLTWYSAKSPQQLLSSLSKYGIIHTNMSFESVIIKFLFLFFPPSFYNQCIVMRKSWIFPLWSIIRPPQRMLLLLLLHLASMLRCSFSPPTRRRYILYTHVWSTHTLPHMQSTYPLSKQGVTKWKTCNNNSAMVKLEM